VQYSEVHDALAICEGISIEPSIHTKEQSKADAMSLQHEEMESQASPVQRHVVGSMRHVQGSMAFTNHQPCPDRLGPLQARLQKKPP
jgi:hypothetical protein